MNGQFGGPAVTDKETMFKRILMSATDASPGNGAPATPPVDVPPAQAAPQAQGAPTATVSIDDFKQLKTTLEDLAKSVNSLHAADRRAREGKQPAAADDKTKTPTVADDPSSQLALRDAFDDATSEMKLTKGQRSLLREHVTGKRPHPSDVDSVVAEYVSKAGWLAAPAATPAAPGQQGAAPQAAPAQPTNAQPASSRGAPAPTQVPLEEMKAHLMSVTDRDAFIQKYGMKKYLEKAKGDLKGVSIDPRR